MFASTVGAKVWVSLYTGPVMIINMSAFILVYRESKKLIDPPPYRF